MKNLIKAIGLSMSLIGCTTLPINYSNYERSILTNHGNGIVSFGYDTNKDGYEDLRFFYEYLNGDESSSFFELLAVVEDKNKNYVFEPDEFVYKRESEEQITDNRDI